METKSTFDIKSFASKISGGLKKAQQEIEEMAVQFSLGKADTGDKFEEIKKEFNAKVNEWKQHYAGMKTVGGESALKLKARFEELQVQLALGRAEARDIFAKQKKEILNSIAQLEAEIRKNPEMNAYLSEFKSETEKLKLKLDILKLKFELKNFEMKEGFKDEMNDARKEIDKLFLKVGEKWDKTKSKYADFSEEIDQAYKHIKKAVGSL